MSLEKLIIHTSNESERQKVIEKIVSLLERMTVSYEWREKKKQSKEEKIKEENGKCQKCGKPSQPESKYCEECIRLNIGEVYFGD